MPVTLAICQAVPLLMAT
jgi:hypothetical protein